MDSVAAFLSPYIAKEKMAGLVFVRKHGKHDGKHHRVIGTTYRWPMMILIGSCRMLRARSSTCGSIVALNIPHCKPSFLHAAKISSIYTRRRRRRGEQQTHIQREGEREVHEQLAAYLLHKSKIEQLIGLVEYHV